MIHGSSALTITAKGGLLRALICGCSACAGFDPKLVPANQRPSFEKFQAIWDTGATASVITQDVVNKCGLKPTGMKEVHGVHGKKLAETFLANIRLPNAVMVPNVDVTLGDLAGADVLIGMDIITLGDFSITNVGGITVFSFRYPSQKTVDFVEEHKAAQSRRTARKVRRKSKRRPKGSPKKPGRRR